MANLHDTRMGAQLIRGTMPEIAVQLKRIADALEAKSNSEEEDVPPTFVPYINGEPNIVDKPEVLICPEEPWSCKVKEQLVESIRSELPYDPNDRVMAQGGEEYWNLQVDRAMDFLTTEINDLVDNVVNDLLEGGYAMQRE
jgi:hypothetical protein